MKAILISVILLAIASLLISGCGIGTPERQAREQYEHSQRFDAEMERDWISLVLGFIIGGLTVFILIGILWYEDRRKWFEVTR